MESYNTWLPPAYADNTKAGSFKSYFTAGTFSNTASPNTFVTFMDIIQYFDKGIQEDKWNLRDGPSSSPYNQIFFCPSDLNPNHYVGKGHVESISYGANMAAWAVNS